MWRNSSKSSGGNSQFSVTPKSSGLILTLMLKKNYSLHAQGLCLRMNIQIACLALSKCFVTL